MENSQFDVVFGSNIEDDSYHQRIEEVIRRRDEAERAVFLPIVLATLWVTFALAALALALSLPAEFTGYVGAGFGIGTLMFLLGYIILRPKNGFPDSPEDDRC